MDSLKMQSPNLVDANVEKIAALFPNCITEDRDENGIVRRVVDFDLLRQELSASLVEGPRERYTLNWPGKNEAILTANAPIAKTLRPCKEESVDFDNTQNIYIEGDNLDALKLLQETYLNKIKMIYIDPPYNTGNDFIYEDDFAEDTEAFFQRSNQKDEQGNRLTANTDSNGRFHSDWISMIYSRLKLARTLLTDDGVIFISIDDNEIHNLRKICDEVFGESNFVASFIWEKKYTTSNNIAGVSSVHEYIVCYIKDFTNLNTGILRLEYTEEARARYKNPDNDPRGDWMDVSYHGPKTPAERPNLNYAIIHPKSGQEIWPKEKSWAYEKSSYEAHVKEGRLWWGKDFSYSEPRLKKYIEEIEGGLIPRSLLTNKSVGGTSVGRNDLRLLFNNKSGAIFDNPKPCSLIEHLINVGSYSDSTILDFFSGSASTAHAVMNVNASDNSNRKYILVQLPEICEEKSEAFKAGYKTIAEIGKERIRRAGKKINEDNPAAQSLDTGFRVFKVDTSNLKDVYYTPDELKQDNLELFKDHIKSDRSPEDLLFQVFIDWGLDLTLPIAKETIDGKTVFIVDTNALIACFDSGINEELVKKLAAHKPLRAVFRDDAFGSDSVKINVEQIFKSLSPVTEVKSI